MILLQLSGGLGNQMFQYAFGKYLAIQNNTNLVLDLSYVQSKLPFGKWTTPQKYELDIFNIKDKTKDNLFRSKLFYPFAKLEHIAKTKFNKTKYNFYHEKEMSFDSDFLNIKGNSFVCGNFQSEKYFISIEKNIRHIFQFPAISDSINLEHLSKIKNTNSVSMHIRRGDYVSIQKNASKFIALDINYYQQAIAYIASKVDNPTFYIFSDDIDWVEENLKINFDKYYIKNNNSKNTSYIDMQLMSICKHNIIANSTFSWWAAWLNANKNKIVVAPKKWFNHIEVKDMLPETWITK